MLRYEYKVVPAPAKGIKGKGVRGAEARFSFALEELMNTMAADGWEYQRAETLPSVERAGIASTTTEWRNVLVFRRPHAADAAQFHPELLPAPTDQMEDVAQAFELPSELRVEKSFKKPSTSNDPLPDNGVEDTQANSTIGASLSILARARRLAERPITRRVDDTPQEVASEEPVPQDADAPKP